MKLLARFFIVALCAVSLLPGCANQTPDRKAQWAATGQWLAAKAENIALSTIASVATSQLDGSAKADWMDSLSAGLLTQATASFGSTDVEKLIGIWTPAKPHWAALGDQLAALADNAGTLPPEQRAAALAKALQSAAAQLRAESTAPTQVLHLPATEVPGPASAEFRPPARLKVGMENPLSELPADLPETLYHGGAVVAPIVVLNGETLP